MHLETTCKVRTEKLELKRDESWRKYPVGIWIQPLSTVVPMTFPCAEEAFAGAIIPKGEMMPRRPGLILILGRQV